METDNFILKVRGLKKSFGNLEVLKGIDFDVMPQELVFIIGPSGSGKSTLLRCFNLLETPTEGSIIVDDVDKFEGHIACSSLSKYEIVIPLRNKEKVIGVLDIDHDKYKFFDSTDKKYLKKIIKKLEQTLD